LPHGLARNRLNDGDQIFGAMAEFRHCETELLIFLHDRREVPLRSVFGRHRGLQLMSKPHRISP
jgi:hypothetical protein